MKGNHITKAHLQALSLLVFSPQRSAEAVQYAASLDQAGLEGFFRLADIHHVVILGLQPLAREAVKGGQTHLAALAQARVDQEQARIDRAVAALEEICAELEGAGCPVAVMKTLDHWPDFGTDIDLITMADERRVESILLKKFQGRLLTRSIGDHLAHKRNYQLRGLRESVEIHAGRLGPAGEHVGLAQRFLDRRVAAKFDGRVFLLPAPEERIIEGTLERMYRHLYFRLCDIVDAARVVECEPLDFEELRIAADLGGIWAGVATNLRITSEYIGGYRGKGLQLPEEVVVASCFGENEMVVRSKYMWVPLVPQSVSLFARQYGQLARSGNIAATARLSLLPPLAGAAGLAYAIGANSERIW